MTDHEKMEALAIKHYKFAKANGDEREMEIAKQAYRMTCKFFGETPKNIFENLEKSID